MRNGHLTHWIFVSRCANLPPRRCGIKTVIERGFNLVKQWRILAAR